MTTKQNEIHLGIKEVWSRRLTNTLANNNRNRCGFEDSVPVLKIRTGPR